MKISFGVIVLLFSAVSYGTDICVFTGRVDGDIENPENYEAGAAPGAQDIIAVSEFVSFNPELSTNRTVPA